LKASLYKDWDWVYWDYSGHTLTLPTEKYASSVKGAAANKIGVKEIMQAAVN